MDPSLGVPFSIFTFPTLFALHLGPWVSICSYKLSGDGMRSEVRAGLPVIGSPIMLLFSGSRAGCSVDRLSRKL